MKKILRVVSFVLVMVMAASLFAGCGKKTTKEDGKIQISVGGWPAKEGTALDTRNKRKAEFEKKYPNVEIIPDTWAWDLQTFYPKAAAGLLPNTYSAPFSEVSKLMENDYLADLTDVLKEKGYLDKFNEKALSAVTKDGRVMAYPQDVYLVGLTYNVDLFKEAGMMSDDGTPKQPKDWKELTEMAVEIKEKTGKPGFALYTSGNMGGWILTNIAWSFGVDFMKQDKNGKWKSTFNCDEMVDALQWVKDLKWKYDVLPSDTNLDFSNMEKTFATGGAAMILAAPTTSRYAAYDMKPASYGFMAIPAGPEKRVALLGGNMFCVTKESSKEQIEALVDWWELTGTGIGFDDARKEVWRTSLENNINNGHLVGVFTLGAFNEKAPYAKGINELKKEMANVPENQVRLYNESLTNPDIIAQLEEPVCAQDLYGVLDNCIQEVLTNKNADCKKLIKKAASEFQTNFLDKFGE